MGTVIDLKNRLSKIDVGFEAQSAIDATKSDMKSKQTDQLLHGRRSDGKPIGKYKSVKYARMKNKLNPLAGFGNVDLKLTGDFQKSIFVDVRDKSYVIDSGDEKSAQLQQKYGEDVFGLDKDNKKDYVEESLRPEFMKQIREKTGL